MSIVESNFSIFNYPAVILQTDKPAEKSRQPPRQSPMQVKMTTNYITTADKLSFG